MTHSTSNEATKFSPWRYLSGAAIAGAFAIAFYWMTAAVAQTFASKPVTSDNPIVVNLSTVVRTLVVGMTALGTGIFALVSIGLVAYTVQTIFRRLKNNQ
ncbi:MAG: DUF3082 domain-containing protein [Cyanophyceae cyanobacterium]